jgi:hypothetical protein
VLKPLENQVTFQTKQKNLTTSNIFNLKNTGEKLAVTKLFQNVGTLHY